MPRGLVLALIFVSSACAAMWPDKLGDYQRQATGDYQRQATEIVQPTSDAQLAEYGMDSGETANYGAFTVTALRFKDVTGAYAASLDPANKDAIRVGNYLISCSGKCPKNIAALANASLPHVSEGSLPPLPAYFTSKNLVRRSERYILGPVGLAADAPEIPASAVGFDFGTEGEIAHYRTPAGPVTLAIFSFPLPSMARQQLPQFQKIANAAVKRTGPLIAVAIGASPAESQLLTS